MVEIATLPDRTPTTGIEDILQAHINSIKVIYLWILVLYVHSFLPPLAFPETS